MRAVLMVELGGVDPGTGSEKMVIKAVRTPFAVKGANVPQPFTLAPHELAAWGTPNAVQRRGQLIRDRLRAHAGIDELLERLDRTAVDDVNPLYVVLGEGNAELISWETLCTAANHFVALDKRWPMGRISDPMSGKSRRPPTLRLPVKVMAIISAFGVPAQEREWEILCAAMVMASKKGLDIRLKLLVGHPTMRTAIDAAIAGGRRGVEVSHIDNTASRVIQEIIAWEPNVVHFFCHGLGDATDQSLELATASDYLDAGMTSGSVKIGIKSLVDMSLSLDDPWLLTLNCCASGQAAKDLHSMAHQVVSAGFPAAIAMLEPVAASDAHEFTRAFYASVFGSLLRAKETLEAQPYVPFEWAHAMYDARTAIRDLHNRGPESSREWTLPVLYVRGVEPLNFLRPHSDLSEKVVREYKLKAQLCADWLQVISEVVSAEERLAVMKKTLADVPDEFWPTVDGTFPNV